MTRGRPVDPTRAKRKTGNRPLPGSPPPAVASTPPVKPPAKPRAPRARKPKEVVVVEPTDTFVLPAGLTPEGESKEVVVVEPTDTFVLPAGLTPEGEVMLRRIIAELEPRGLREADIDALTMMCHSAYVHQKAREFVANNGVVLLLNGRPVVNPAIKVARDEAATYLRLATEYGLTLAARLRLGLMQLAGESMLSSLNSDLDRGDVTISVRV